MRKYSSIDKKLEMLSNEHRFEVVPQHIPTKFSKVPTLIPLLFVNGQLEKSFFYYITEGKIKSSSFETKKQAARSVGLYLEFYLALPENEREIATTETSYATILKINKLSESFYGLLKKGSLHLVDDRALFTKPPEEWGYNGLIWRKKPTIQANKTMLNVEKYLFFCATKLNYFSIEKNDWPSIAKVAQCAYRESCYYPNIQYGPQPNKGYNKKYNFLSHLNDQSRNTKHERKTVRYAEPSIEQNPFGIEKDKADKCDLAPSKCFPDSFIYKMLIDANMKKKSKTGPLHEWLNVRNVILFSAYLLQGRRLSEPPHSWINDIQIFNGSIQWAFFEPTEAPVSDGGGTREDYLLHHYGILPFTKLKGNKRLGWKGIAFNEPKYMVYFSTFFAPSAILSKFLPAVHRSYLEHVRPKYMAKSEKDHPYYFVTKNGDPLSNRDNIRNLWMRACRRIGLTGEKEYGHSIHCCRHRIKKVAEQIFKDDPSLSEKVRAVLGEASSGENDDMNSKEKTRRVMGHRSITSQNSYDRKGMAEISQSINNAYNKIEKGALSGKNISNEHIVHPLDPQNRFPETFKKLEEYL